VKSTGENCFYWCSSLQTLIFLKLTKIIPNACFSGCSSLASIILHNQIEIFEYFAFLNARRFKLLKFQNWFVNWISLKKFFSKIYLKNNIAQKVIPFWIISLEIFILFFCFTKRGKRNYISENWWLFMGKFLSNYCSASIFYVFNFLNLRKKLTERLLDSRALKNQSMIVILKKERVT
jgi:hypothetical protein